MADSSDSVSIDMEALSLGGQVRIFLVFFFCTEKLREEVEEDRRNGNLLIFFFIWFLHSSSCFVPDDSAVVLSMNSVVSAISGIVCYYNNAGKFSCCFVIVWS